VVEELTQFGAGVAIAVIAPERISPGALGGEGMLRAVRIGREGIAVGCFLRLRHFDVRGIIDGCVGETPGRESDGGAMQIDEAALLEAPSDYGDAVRPFARELVKAAEGKEHVLEGIERELFRGGAVAHAGSAPPAEVLGEKPVALGLAAGTGGGKGLGAGEDKDGSRIGGREFDGVMDMFDVEAGFAALKVAEVPGTVGARVVAEVPDGVAGGQD